MATIGIVGGILAIVVSLGTLASFVIYLFKEAIAKGRLYQRIDYMEKTQNDSEIKHTRNDTKLACHDGDFIKVTGDIESLRDLMERTNKNIEQMSIKLDRFMEVR